MTLLPLKPFLLEEYLEKREFAPGHLFCASDVQTRSLGDILQAASPAEREDFLGLSLGYTHPRGHPQLREEIAKLYEATTPDAIACFTGAEEGIFCAMHTLLFPGDHVIVVTPAYQSLYSLAQSRCQVSQLALREQGGRWCLDADELEALITNKTKLIVINFPHNPTGMIPDRATYDAVISAAAKHGCYLFSDEVYRYLELDEADRLPAACDLYPRALSLGVMSKSFGLSGLRLGWIATQDKDLLERLVAMKHYLSICASAPSEQLAIMALRQKERILSGNLELVRRNFELVRSYFLQHPHMFGWRQPQGGCIAYLELLHGGSVGDFAEHLYQSKAVVILPSHVYEQTSQHFRIGFGRRDLPVVLELFADFVEETWAQRVP